MIKIPCEVYSKVVGYLTRTDGWNPGKQQEFKDRKMYTHIDGELIKTGIKPEIKKTG